MFDRHKLDLKLEDSLRNFVSRGKVRNILWEGEARHDLIGALVDEVGQQRAKQISHGIDAHLAAMSLFGRFAELFRQKAVHAKPLDFLAVIAAIRKLDGKRHPLHPALSPVG